MSVQNLNRSRAHRARLADQLFIAGSTVAYGALMGLVFFAYAAGMWGYCLVRGYDVTFAQVFAPAWPGATAKKTA